MLGFSNSVIKIFCNIFLKVCTGSYRATNALAPKITDTDEYLQAVKTGLLVTVYLKNCEKFRIISDVETVNKADFTITLLREVTINLGYWT